MEIDDVDADDFLGPMGHWAMPAVWDEGLTYKNVNARKEAFDKIIFDLFSQNPLSLRFQQTMAYLAFAGATEDERILLERDIEELKLTPDGIVVQTGFGKKVGEFWKNHWKKVVIGAVVVAVVIVVSLSASAAVAGSQLCKSKKKKKAPKKIANEPLPKKIKTEKSTSSIEVEKPLEPSSFLEHESPKTSSELPDYLESFTCPETQRQITFDSFLPSFDYRKQESLSILDKSLPFSESLKVISPTAVKPMAQKPDIPKSPPSILEMIKRAHLEKLFPSQKADLPKPTKQLFPPFPRSSKKKSICRIGGINGINTSAEDAAGHAEYLKGFASQAIEWVYNRTHGKVPDLAEVFMLNYQGCSPNTAKELKANWTVFHEKHKNNSRVKYLQFCHSQGAIHVKNALQSAPKEISDRVVVVAIAPAAVVSKKFCYRSFNYASKKDIVYLGELVSSCMNVEPVDFIMTALKQEKELILLEPHPDAKGIDHDFQSPTFREEIKKRITEYLINNGEYE